MTERHGYFFSDLYDVSITALPDIFPEDGDAAASYAALLATDVTFYSMPGVRQYVQMYEQAVDEKKAGYTGFGVWQHQRELATPDFEVFGTANVDTLYSSAWLDLTRGPVRITIPPIADRYYTVALVDMHAHAANLSLRTIGPEGGSFLLTLSEPTGDTRSEIRVATQYIWLLLRLGVRADGSDLKIVHDLQDRILLQPEPAGSLGAEAFPSATPQGVLTDARQYLEVADWLLRQVRRPVQEDGYVYRFRAIGVGTGRPGLGDPAVEEALEAGFGRAMEILQVSKHQVGMPVAGTVGWTAPDVSRYGFNYFHRALVAVVGTGGNVPAENQPFTTFLDGEANPLDGRRGTYELRLPILPDCAHWSLTLYKSGDHFLYPNRIDRYAIRSDTPSLRFDPEGGLTIRVQQEAPQDPANWLPCPDAEFYLVLRTWLPGDDILRGRWVPPPVGLSQPSGGEA